MRKFLVTAAALTLGTSALAWAPMHEDAHAAAGADMAMESKTAWNAGKGAKSVAGWTGKSGSTMASTALGMYQAATATWGDGMTSAAWGEKGEELVPAAFAKWQDPTVQTAAAVQMEAKPVSAEGSFYADADAPAMGKPRAHAQGVGGPYEAVDARSATGANLSQQAEFKNYPPCDPGPGDDHCIQLYESGVRTQLAHWNREGGGLWTGNAAVAMGGPYEPAAEGTKPAASDDHASMDHSVHAGTATGSADMSATVDQKPAADATMTASVTKPAATTETIVATTPGAIGGPIEERTGYPPCDPGPGDDRCIQLYESGVTGQGN